MNVQEAKSVNTVLRYILGLRKPEHVDIDDQEIRDDAEAEAAWLATRARAVLPDGLTRDQVHDAWKHLELGPWLDHEGVPISEPAGGTSTTGATP
ncbi:MAG: hypothetical protein J2P19_18485 [Pseudonocardia sp.]|nr:hypothetical protein [Pseudonocardia sp.]